MSNIDLQFNINFEYRKYSDNLDAMLVFIVSIELLKCSLKVRKQSRTLAKFNIL